MRNPFFAYAYLKTLMFFRSFFFVFVGIMVGSQYGMSQTMEYEHFSDEHGLLSAHVSAVVKDTEGFMWIGTKQGLDRYDGYNCKHFINDPSNPKSIPENNIRCLFDDGGGKIYIGFFGRGFCIFDKRTEEFENHTYRDDTPNVVRHDTVFTFYPDRNGAVWIGTSLGLDHYDPNTKQITHHQPFRDLLKQDVSSIDGSGEGYLWLYGAGNQPCKMNVLTHSCEYLQHDSLKTKAGSGYEAILLLDKQQNLWFGNEWEGLYKYHLPSKKLERFRLQNGLLKSDIINCMVEDSEGNIWVGTEGAGLYKYNTRQKGFEKYQYIANLPNNLRSNYISCLYESHPGILWIGSTTYGLSIWKRDKSKFKKFGVKGEEGERLSNSSVLSISPAPNGKMWIGTDGGGLNLYDPQTNKFQYFTTENSPLCNNSIKSIYLDKKGTMWYGTFERGLCNVNFETGKATNFQKELIGNEKKGVANCAWTLCGTSDNKLWLGLLQGGIKIIDLNTEKFVDILCPSPEFRKLISLRIQVIFEDSKKRIWIGTENFGLICYYPSTQQYIHFTPDDGNKTSIKSKNIKTVFEDKEGDIWVGLQKGGLGRLLSMEKKSFLTYTVADGLPNNNVKDIVEDHYGNLWLGTEKGISCFYREDHFFRNFDMQDGLQGANFHSNSNFKTKGGYIYMGGIDGFNLFHPDSLHFNKKEPRVMISDFKVYDKSLVPNHLVNGRNYLDESVQFLQKMHLRHSDDVFSIEFVALDFLSPQKDKYAYKLEGFNNNWTYVDPDHRQATYTNLNPGRYVFRVIASNGDGVWNKEGTSLEIIIHPPFYLTWWFRLSTALIILGSLIAFYFWRTRSIRRRNLQLKKEVESQTKKLRETNEKLLLTAEELALQNRKSLELYQELTEGLEAAKVIQTAILPGKELLERSFHQIDIFYKPKDVVSGDFYWYTKIGNNDVIAVVDCTGHGVAGAFMTFVAYEILNQISKREIPADPGLIISLLNQEILTSMNHYQSGFVNAGMDVALCLLDSHADTLYFAGANNPLYIVRGDEVLTYKGDRQGIGGKQKSEKYMFKTISVVLEQGDQVYLFTDGYADQLGGESGTDKFMYTRFRQTLMDIKGHDTKTRIQLLGQIFEEWRGAQEQLDDVLVVGFEYHARY